MKEIMIKVAIVSSIRPETNYSAYLIEAFQKEYSDKVEVLSYCEKEKENETMPLLNKKYCWNRDWRYFFQILGQARQDKVDLLHFQHEINMFGGPRTAVIFPFLILFSRLLGFKPVVTIHAVVPRAALDEGFLKVFQWPRPKIFTPLVQVVFPTLYFLIGLFADKIIVHSLGLKSTLVSDYHVNGSKIEVVPHGVPTVVDGQISTISQPLRDQIEGRKFILYFGYLHRRKGLEVLVEAFKQISDQFAEIDLVLAGGAILPNYHLELKDLIDRLGLTERVVVTGFIKLADLRFLLDRCLFVVLPAIYSIAASGPLAQVFAQGKAVVVSDLGVFREEVRHGEEGLLVKVNRVDDLARQMERLIRDNDLRQRIESNNRLVAQKRSWPKVAGQTLAVYQQLIQ